MTDVVFRSVEVDGHLVDVHASDGVIVAVGPQLSPPGGVAEVLGGGGALIPGLHDHHVHLLATAAAAASLPVGPPAVRTEAELVAALGRADRSLPAGQWIRAVGYHESVAGDLDRHWLDAHLSTRPVRIQHRTGARWTLSSAALARVGPVPRSFSPDDDGRLHRADDWLRNRIGRDAELDLASVGDALARVGVTGVTDTTPFAAPDGFEVLAAAVRSGILPSRIVVTGGIELVEVKAPDPLLQGPVKVVIDDGDLPAVDDVASWLTTAHRAGRPVAVHCVTAVALAVALAAWDAVGAVAGDRVEHGSVVPAEAIAVLAGLGVTVVTQPGFVAVRGDQYLADVDPVDRPSLYRLRSLIDGGVPVGLSTDSPYTDLDPWAAIGAAVERRTPSGQVIGADERLTAREALDCFLTDPADPGCRPRRIRPGAPADVCLLDVPLSEALRDPNADHVRWSGSAG